MIILKNNYHTRFEGGFQSWVFALRSTEMPMRKVKSAYKFLITNTAG